MKRMHKFNENTEKRKNKKILKPLKGIHKCCLKKKENDNRKLRRGIIEFKLEWIK